MKNFQINTYTKKIIFVFALVLPMLGFVSSCKKDFLLKKPELNLLDQDAFANPTRILAQVNGLYTSVKSGNFLGGRYQIYNDIRGEDFVNRLSNGVTGYTVYQATNNNSDNNVTNLWTYGYLTINRVNLFLQGLSQNPGILSAAIQSNYEGEAKFVRALSYFSLIQIFAKPYVSDNGVSRGLPLRLQAEQSLENNDLKSSTVAAVYTQILKDLNDAEVALPATYSTPLLRTTRAHKNTAIALKLRVYMAMGKYPEALIEGNKLVPQTAPFQNATNVAHALQPNIANVFAAPYTTSESIFSLPFADTNAPGTQNQLGYYFNAGNLEYYFRATAGIYGDAAWPVTDTRKSALTAVFTGIGPYSTKFSGNSPYVDFVPIIRYAEVLLNVAECEASVSGGNLVRARAILDAVRQRSDATYNFGVLTPITLLTAILKERRIELITEGFNYNDFARRNMALPSFGAGSSIPVTDARYTFPIPLLELNTNKLVNNF